MARSLRVKFDGALHHVTSRGNAREDNFEEDGDRKAFLETLGKVINRFKNFHFIAKRKANLLRIAKPFKL